MSPPVLRPSRLRMACAAAAVFGFLAASPTASAESLTLTFTNTNSSTKVSGSAGGSSFSNVTPGPYSWNQSGGGALQTYCVEMAQGIASGPINYTVTQIVPGQASGVFSANQATLLSELYGQHYSPTLSGSNATAFQLALWEIVYDSNKLMDSNGNYLTDSNAFGGGSFKVTSITDSAAKTTAQNWLNSLGSGGTYDSSNMQLVWLSNSKNQDQIGVIPGGGTPPPVHGVPAPPAVLLGLFGIGSCLLGRRFRNRTAAAV